MSGSTKTCTPSFVSNFGSLLMLQSIRFSALCTKAKKKKTNGCLCYIFHTTQTGSGMSVAMWNTVVTLVNILKDTEEKVLLEFSRRLRRLPRSVFISIRPRQINFEPYSLSWSSGQRVFERWMIEDALIPFIISKRHDGYSLFLLKLSFLFDELPEWKKRRFCRIGLATADQLPAEKDADFVRNIPGYWRE